jgi:hypothetical protein
MKKLIFSVLTPLMLPVCMQAQDVLHATTGSVITVQNGATLYVGGGLTLDNTSTLNNAGTITIARTAAPTADFTDNTPAPHSYGNGKFIFTGAGGGQNMLGSLFYDLDINNTAGVTMLGNHTVNNNLALTSGSLLLANNILTLNGPVTGTGSLSGSSTSALVIGGTAGTINFNQTSAATRSLNNLTLNSGSSATLGNALDIYGTVALTSAGLNLNAKNLTLKSTPTNTARIANLTGSTLTGGTNVTMERFIKLRTPGTGIGAANYGRAYRLVCPTVNTTGHPTKPTIRDNWMEGGLVNSIGGISNPVPNFGTNITGAGGNANGFDVTQTNQYR